MMCLIKEVKSRSPFWDKQENNRPEKVAMAYINKYSNPDIQCDVFYVETPLYYDLYFIFIFRPIVVSLAAIHLTV